MNYYIKDSPDQLIPMEKMQFPLSLFSVITIFFFGQKDSFAVIYTAENRNRTKCVTTIKPYERIE